MLYGNRDSSSVIFLEALAALKDKLSRPASNSIISSTPRSRTSSCSTACSTASGCDEAIAALVPMRREVDGWFICGPGPMMDAAEGALLDRNVAKERIHIERFTADRPSGGGGARDGAAADQGGGRDASRSRSTAAPARVRSPPATSSTARAPPGLPAPFACKAGVCATCRAKVTKGKVEMAARYGLTDEEVAAGYVLTCQSVPVGDGVAVDYDA